MVKQFLWSVGDAVLPAPAASGRAQRLYASTHVRPDYCSPGTLQSTELHRHHAHFEHDSSAILSNARHITAIAERNPGLGKQRCRVERAFAKGLKPGAWG